MERLEARIEPKKLGPSERPPCWLPILHLPPVGRANFPLFIIPLNVALFHHGHE
jgi:hypothetical protein